MNIPCNITMCDNNTGNFEKLCMFLYPDSKRCAENYGEGPDADYEEEDNE